MEGSPLESLGTEDPAALAVSDIAAKLIGELVAKDYSVLQLTSDPANRAGARRAVESLTGWMHLVPDFEVSYCGRELNGKVLWLDAQEEAAADASISNLAACDQEVTQICEEILPLMPSLGFFAVERTSALLRAPFAGADEEQRIRKEAQDYNAVDAKMLQEYLSFLDRRKVCMIYPLSESSGGRLLLHPRYGGQDIELPLQSGSVILFRHDCMDYSCMAGDSVVMQAWLLRERLPSDISVGEFADIAKVDAQRTPPQYGETQTMVACTAFSGVLCGNVNTAEEVYAMYLGATDCPSQMSILRYDIDEYWSKETQPGKMYVRHFGILSTEQFSTFAYEFFGYTEEEAMVTSPIMRKPLEVTYDTLIRAGYTKALLAGTEMTVSGTAQGDIETRYITGLTAAPVTPDTLRFNTPAFTSNRIQYIFGLRGPTYVVDTACSSSLTATCLGHSSMRPYQSKQLRAGVVRTDQVKSALIYGTTGQFDPAFCIGLCGAGMLSHAGRCFTFDQSADGFIRSEGVGSMYWRQCLKDDPLFLGELVGSSLNQDGRSASLTAPHGPSQQECIRQSLGEARVDPLVIQIQELHGTGTPLGDPIEVGALRATMMTYKGTTRSHPIVKTSSKANIGHSEASAGITGIMKCVVMAMSAMATPNLHLRLLNPHIDDSGYPVLFTPECLDQGRPDGYMGVSSFGFSGCNARGDVWGTALQGPHSLHEPLDLSAERWMKASERSQLALLPWAGQSRQSQLKGVFMVGDTKRNISELFISGSWNQSREKQRMEDEGEGKYSFTLQLGDTLVEDFVLWAADYKESCIFPDQRNADQTALVIGPGQAPSGHRWVIDGRGLGLQGRPSFKVTFEWQKESGKKVTWAPTHVDGAPSPGPCENRYFVVASWASWQPLLMQATHRNPSGGRHMCRFKIGQHGYEKFQIWRDRDSQQIIYPAVDDALASSVPLRGPDEYGHNKFWRIPGRVGEEVTAIITTSDGTITVSVSSDRKGQRSWVSSASSSSKTFCVKGSWSNELEPMIANGDGTYTLRVTLDHLLEAQFQILVDGDPERLLYPEMDLATTGFSALKGPDAFGEDFHWRIEVEFTACDIVLDLNQPDPRKRVTWQSAFAHREIEYAE